MNQLNSIIIEGNVVRNPELSEPCEGFKVCAISVAVNRYYKNRNGENVEEVSYFDVETYGKMAEISSTHATKGRGVRVVGRLKQSRWTDKDGKNFSKVFVVAEHIEWKPIFNTSNEEEKTATEEETENSEMCF